MPATKGVKQKAYARSRATKADVQRKRAAQNCTLESLHTRRIGSIFGDKDFDQSYEGS